MIWPLVLISLLSLSNAQSPYEFLVTFGGFSYYKVKIDSTKFPSWTATTFITDDVVSQVCQAATGGPNPQAPCSSNTPSCAYYNNQLCMPAAETGCAQPFQSLALAMGCTYSFDPKCLFYSATLPVYRLAGAKGG
eukprot:PhF_6_TR29463/c0_g1_i1/m.43657